MSISSETLKADEPTLIRQALEGSHAAFAQLIRTHLVSVRWVLASLLRDRSVVDDLAQEVFLHAFEHLSSFRASGSLRSWLTGIARNKAKEFIRSEVRRRGRESSPIAIAFARWRLERLEAEATRIEEADPLITALHDCLQGLALKSRKVVHEHYFESRTLEALSKEQGSTSGSLRMLLLRIRKALSECLRKKLPGEV